MDIAKEINKIIKENKFSREDIASRLGVASTTIYRWQKGRIRPKSRLVLKAIENLKKELKRINKE